MLLRFGATKTFNEEAHVRSSVCVSLAPRQPRFSRLIDSRHFAFNYPDSVPPFFFLFRRKHQHAAISLELNGIRALNAPEQRIE